MLNSIIFTSVLNNSSTTLKTIGNINWSKVRVIQQLTNLDIDRLLNIPYNYLARLAGIIDGDGYIDILASDAKRQYHSILIRIKLLHSELPLLLDIVKTLVIGRITGPYKNIKGEPFVSLTINKTELQQVMFPLFLIFFD